MQFINQIKKPKKKKSNKHKNTKEPQNIYKNKSSHNSKSTSKTLIPSIDTEFSDEDKAPIEKEIPFVPSTKYIQGLTYEIDENDSGGWELVNEKKSKRLYTETSIENETVQENEKRPKAKNKLKSRKPINKVPGMTD